jgi:hypothetical protein
MNGVIIDSYFPFSCLKALEDRFDVHQSGRVIAFDCGGCPYKEHLYELEAEEGIAGFILYAVFPDQNGTWRVAAIGVQVRWYCQVIHIDFLLASFPLTSVRTTI